MRIACHRRWHRTQGSALFQTHSASWASSALLFGLAPRGVCRAGNITVTAVGSYPTFSPLPSSRSMRRHPEGFPPGYHRDTLRWRYFLCGTIRDAALSNRIPWRYQARRPNFACVVASLSTGTLSLTKWCPDFPPVYPEARCRRAYPSTTPLKANQRSSSSPAIVIIPRNGLV